MLICLIIGILEGTRAALAFPSFKGTEPGGLLIHHFYDIHAVVLLQTLLTEPFSNLCNQLTCKR